MRYFVSFTTGLVVIIAFTFLISGCGSDDERVSSPPEPQSPFSGEYHYVQMTGVSNQNNTPFRSETGRMVTARKDSVRFEAAHVAYNGSLEGPINPPDRLLDLMDDRGVAFTDPAGFVVQGRFRPDGGFAVLHSDKADAQLGFLLAARRNPAPVQDDFEGKWGLVQYGLIQATPPATGQIGLGARGKVLVDGNGGIEFQEYTYNRGGKVNPMRVFHVPSELVPDGDGGVVWRNLSLNQVEFIGGLSEDGNLILLGAVGGFNGQAGIRVLVREGLTSSLAEVAGNYLSGGCTMKDSMIPPGPFAMNGEMALNGSGVGLWTTTTPLSVLQPWPLAYNLESGGYVAMNTNTVPVLLGVAGLAGDYLIMVGPFQSGVSEPWFQAVVR